MTRLALLLCLFAGCVRVPVVPVPPEPDVVVADGTIDGLTSAFNAKLRDAYRKSAASIDSETWTTEEQLFNGEQQLIDDAFDSAALPLATRMQVEAGGKPLKEQAAFRRKISEERQ